MSIFTRAFNKFGGYDELAGRFPCATEPEGTRWDHQCVEFGGTMRYASLSPPYRPVLLEFPGAG